MWHLHKDLYFFSGLTSFFKNFPNFNWKKEVFLKKAVFEVTAIILISVFLCKKKLSAPVLLKIMLKLKNPISSCLSILSKSIGEVPYLKPLRRGNIYSRQKSKGWDQEKPYHAIIVYGLSKIYFQQYHVSTFFIYITNILSWVIILTNADSLFYAKSL